MDTSANRLILVKSATRQYIVAVAVLSRRHQLSIPRAGFFLPLGSRWPTQPDRCSDVTMTSDAAGVRNADVVTA